MKFFCRCFLVFWYSVLWLSSSAQSDSVFQSNVITNIEQADETKDFRKILDSCNKYIPCNFSVPIFRAKLLAYKAAALSEVHDSLYRINLMKDDSVPEDSLMLTVIDSLYHAAAKVCANCDLIYVYKAYEYASRYDCQKAEDRHLLEQHGFKDEKEGFWASADFFSGNNAWVGAELSVAQFQQGYKLRRKQNGKMKIFRTEYPYYASVFNIGFRKNVTKNGWAINFAPVTIGGYFVNLRPLNITYFRHENGASFGLCPEAGIRCWYFSAHLGYNFMFRKSMRDYEKFLFNLKLQLPLYMFD